MLDESAARFIGHSARTRVMPEGIRRFATWAPLLIPFYIPRGVEWDQAWNGAEALRAADGALSAPVAAVLAGYTIAAAGSALALGAGPAGARRRPRRAPGVGLATRASPSATAPMRSSSRARGPDTAGS